MNKLPRFLGIDDCRELRHCDVVARSYDEGIRALTLMGPWDCLYLDHDLNAIKNSWINDREATGYDIVCFLEEHPDLRPAKVVLVTSNPTGRLKMVAGLKRIYGPEYTGRE